MATNNFLPFTPTDTGTNLLTQGEYAVATQRDVGNQPGVASSKLNNKAIRQANVIASQLAQYICNKTGLDMLDNGDLTTLLATLTAGLGPTTQEYDITNLTLTTSVNAGALTIAVKTKAGTDATATNVITVGMRSSTLTSGVYNTRTLSSSLSMVVSSGSTLGQTSAQPSLIYVYLIDNSGTLELAVSHSYYPEDQLVTTVAEGGAGAADSATAIYSTTLRSNVAIRNIGYILNTQSTAGSWTSAGTQLQLSPTDNYKLPTIQKFTSGSGTYNTPAGAKYIRVKMVGGGGGGCGGTGNGGGLGGSGNPGTDTTFGTTLLVAGLGSGGLGGGGNGGVGGTVSLGTGPIGTAITGGRGGGSSQNPSASFNYLGGGMGSSSPLGGAGSGGTISNAGSAAATNSGSGGGGGGTSQTVSGINGPGGGAGGYIDALIGTNPSSNPLLTSYSYSIGTGGAGGGAGGDGGAGGAGGSGYIEVTEYYQ